jgi:hypothetical protein
VNAWRIMMFTRFFLHRCTFVRRGQKYGHVVGDAQRRAVNTLAEKIERHTVIELVPSAESVPSSLYVICLLNLWSGRWESNPRPKLGKLLYCHCTTPAHSSSLLIIHN